MITDCIFIMFKTFASFLKATLNYTFVDSLLQR